MPRAARPDVVCFGEVLWDIFQTGVGRREDSPTFRPELGGAPANVAVGLARLGVRSALVGAVGRDWFGDALVARLEREGVDVRFVARLDQRTGLTFVTRDARGEPAFLFYRHESADVSLRSEHIAPATGRARWAALGTSTLVTPTLARATKRWLDAAEREGTSIFVDLNVRPHLWPDREVMRGAIRTLVGRAHLVKASDADLRALGGDDAGFAWLRRNAPRAAWVLTRGAGRASSAGEHGEVYAPALRARCVDATGAGDAFAAGVLATLLAAGAAPGSASWREPLVWREALRVGHIMGKKAVSRVGAVNGLCRLGRARAVLERVRARPPRSAP